MQAKAVDIRGDELAVIPMSAYTDMEFGSTGQYQAVLAILGAAPPGTQKLCVYEGSRHVSDYHLQGYPSRLHFITHNVNIRKHVPAGGAVTRAPLPPQVVVPECPVVSDDDEDGLDPCSYSLFD